MLVDFMPFKAFLSGYSRPACGRQVKDAVCYSIVEKARNSKEPLRYQKYPLYKHLQFYTLTKIDCCKIRYCKHKHHDVSYAYITPYPYILKIITLFYVAIRFITFPASKIILHYPPYTLFVVYIHRATPERFNQGHHRLLTKPFYYYKIKLRIILRELYRYDVVLNCTPPFFPIIINYQDCFIRGRNNLR